MKGDQFCASMIIGFFSWASQESLSLALISVKSGTTACFYNISLIIAFVLDVVYFKRMVLWTDIVGATMIMVFTIAQGLLSNEESIKKEEEVE